MNSSKFILPLLLVFFLVGLHPDRAFAYIAGSVSAPEGHFDLGLRLELMRGLSGPLNVPESQQAQRPSVNIYEAATGYNFGELGFIQDLTFRITGQFFVSAAEIYQVKTLYEEDSAGILTFEVSANLVHEVDRSFGFFLRSSWPLGMNLQKFANPKIDRFGFGVQGGVKYTEVLGSEFLIFYGSGIYSKNGSQNASLTAMLPLVLNTKAWIFSNGAALKFGPFFDGDLGDRKESAYGTEAIRSFRLGFAILPSVRVSNAFGLDAGYVQKLSGAYFRATKDFFLGARYVF